MPTVDNRIFAFRVVIDMTEEGLVPKVRLYDSAVDIGVHEAEALEEAMRNAVKDWLEGS